jgi:hypothetical protein
LALASCECSRASWAKSAWPRKNAAAVVGQALHRGVFAELGAAAQQDVACAALHHGGGRLARLFSISRHMETRAGAHRAGHATHRQLATAETNSSG